jgi:hypothetical protein
MIRASVSDRFLFRPARIGDNSTTTLIIARKRENFAILASDGLLSSDPRDIAKIACHPSLPIACTVSGLFALPLPADHPFRKKHSIPPNLSACTTTFISDVLNEITSIDELTTEDIGTRLATRLLPFVNKDIYIACHVAIVKNEKADLGFMVAGMKATWPSNAVDHGEWGWCPDGVRQWCDPPEVADLFDGGHGQVDTSPPQTPDELVAILRTMVNEAIAEELKRTGRKGSIGGTAHLAKVTRDGAFLA